MCFVAGSHAHFFLIAPYFRFIFSVSFSQVAKVRLLFGGVLVECWTHAEPGTADKSFALVNQAQEQYQKALQTLRDLVVLDALEVQGIEKDQDMEPEEHKLALKQATQALNKAHYMLADCLCKIAQLAKRSGDYESAQHHYAEAAEYLETHIGASHPLASEAFLGLGMLLYQRSKFSSLRPSLSRSHARMNTSAHAHTCKITHTNAGIMMPKRPHARPCPYAK